MIEREQWEEIEGFPKYLVSNHGNVFNMHKREDVTLHDNGHDGLKVVLYNNNQQTVFQVHRLVASSFMENFDDRHIVTHRDSNKRNNYVENLKLDVRLKRKRYV